MEYRVGDIVTFNRDHVLSTDRPIFDCEILRQSSNDVTVFLLRPIEDLPCPINQILTTGNTDGTFWCYVNFFRPTEAKPVIIDTSDLL